VEEGRRGNRGGWGRGGWGGGGGGGGGEISDILKFYIQMRDYHQW